MKIKLLSLLFLFIVLQLSFSDNIRGQVKSIVTIDSVPYRADEISLSSENIFAIVLNNREIQPIKIQLEIRLSETLRDYPNTFALFFYNNVTPLPGENISNYRGNLVKYVVLPRTSKHFIDIYIAKQPTRSELIPGTDNIFPGDFKNSFFPMFVTMLPVMKGIPNQLLNESITVKVTPFFPEVGTLSINVFERTRSSSSGSNLNRLTDYKLYIDNNLHNNSDNIVLPTGIKRVRIEKDGYNTFQESVVIRNNEKSSITAYLTNESPYLIIQAPPEAEIFINGIHYRQREFSNLSVGEHTLVFKLGEYSISRKIRLENGKRYLIDILLDIDIREY